MSKELLVDFISNLLPSMVIDIPLEKFNKMFEIAAEFRGRDLSDENVRKEAIITFRKLVENLSGQRILKRINRNVVVQFIQKANNKVEILRDKTDYFNGRLIFSIISHENGSISIKREGDHRLDNINQTNPAYAIEDFLEQEYRLTGRDNRIIRIPLHSIYEEWSTKKDRNKHWYKNLKNSSKLQLDKAFVNKLNKIFGLLYLKHGKELLHVMATITGDNSKLLVIRTPREYRNVNREGFISTINMMINRGLFTEEKKNELLHSIDSMVAKDSVLDHFIWGQTLGRMQWLMSVKGMKFFLREKNIMDTVNKLKQDIAEGITPFGLGDTGVMIFDPKKTIMKSIDPLTGEEKEIKLFTEDDKYVFDGWSMTSQSMIDKLNKLTGSDVQDYKTVIRYLDNTSLTKYDENGMPISGGGVDYIQFKMMEMNPFEGTKLFVKNEDGSRGDLIAKYENGKWFDKDGNEFHRLMSTEERKDYDGRFKELNVINTIPETATKIKFGVKDTNKPVPFPVVWPELLLNNNLKDNELYNKLIKEIKKYYAINSKKYYELLYRAVNYPKLLYKIFSNKLCEKEISDEIIDILITTKNGKSLFHPSYLKQILPIVKNLFIIDGLFKAYDIHGRMGKEATSTSLLIKPKGPLDIKENEIYIGTGNSTLLKYVIKQIFKKDINNAKKLELLLKENTSYSIKKLSIYLNTWLSKNKILVLIYKEPIQSSTKVRPYRIKGFVAGHGNTIFMNTYNVFRVHGANFSGDQLFVNTLDTNKEILNILTRYVKTDAFKNRDYIAELNLFKAPNVNDSLSNFYDSIKVIEYDSKLLNSKGLVVNGINIMNIMAAKNIEIKLKNGKVIIPWNPNERVTLFDFELDPRMINKYNFIINKNKDRILKFNGRYFLNTTKENQLIILQQMILNNKKQFLLNNYLKHKNIDFHNYFIEKIFKAKNGYITNLEKNAIWAVYNVFNYNKIKHGYYLGSAFMWKILDTSKKIAEMYYNFKENKELNIELIQEPNKGTEYFSKIVTEMAKNNFGNFLKISVEIDKVFGDPNISPMEFMFSRLYLYDYKNKLNSGTYKESIMKYSDDRYNWANYKAVEELNDIYAQKLSNMSMDEKKKIDEAIKFTQRMVNDFVMTLDKIHDSKNAITTGEDTYVTPSTIYNEEMAKFVSRWYNAFNSMTDEQKDWSTLNFLSRYIFESGGKLKVSYKRFKLLPFRLMGQNIFNDYINRYYNHLEDISIRQISKSDYDRDYILNKLWHNIYG